MRYPTLSVITPSRNCAAFLEDAIQSVAQQERVTVEHLVLDGLSTDGTLKILRQHPELRWQWESDGGQSDAINRGFLRARGELVGWLNADDYYLPGGLEAITRAAAEHPEADVLYGDFVFVDEQGRIVRSKVEHEFDPEILLYFGCYIASTATFFRRRVIENGMLLNPAYQVCMDFEYFARLAAAGYRFHYVRRVVAAFRWHGSNISLRQEQRRAAERLQVQRRFGPQLSLERLELLRQWARAKRVWRKITDGNAAREVRLRRQRGLESLWMRSREGRNTCDRLACL